MKLRKVIIAILTAATSLAAFAQNADYNALLSKGKDYENKKQFVYALGTYYDAVAAEPPGIQKKPRMLLTPCRIP